MSPSGEINDPSPSSPPWPPTTIEKQQQSSSSTGYFSPDEKKTKTLKSIRRPVRQQTADDDAAHTEKKKWKGHEEEWPLIGSPPIPITLSHPHHPQSNFICVIVGGAMTGFFSLCHSPRPPSTSFYYFLFRRFLPIIIVRVSRDGATRWRRRRRNASVRY